MPRSRSRSIESSTWARIDRGSTVFVISRMRSASVDFPWSMWAMIEKLRMCAWSAMDARLRIGAGAWRGSERRRDRQRLLAGDRDAVANRVPGAVERAVGARQERRVGLALHRHRNADRDRHAEVGLLDRLAQAAAGLERLVGVGDDEQRGELVAADAEERVAPAQRAAQGVGDVAKDLVAVLVAERVVEALEAVEVDEHDRRAGATVRVRERGVERRVMAEAGERVGRGLRAERAHERRGAQAGRGVRGEQLEELDVVDRDGAVGATGEHEQALALAVRDEFDRQEGPGARGVERLQAAAPEVVCGG